MGQVIRFKLHEAVCLMVFACAAVAFGQDDVKASATDTPAADKITIGTLAQTIEKTPIRSNMDDHAKVLSHAEAFQYICVNETKFSKWSAVVLVNGRIGYALSDQIAKLPYNVQVPKHYGLTSRSGGVRLPVAESSSSAKRAMLEQSFEYVGTPYVWGGNSLSGGIDCSGFVKELYKQIGVDLPRTAREQARVGKPIERLEELQPGDRLYFWDSKKGYIGHTGLFLGFYKDGGAYFIHSSSNNKGVGVDDLRNQHWRNMLVAARRS